MSPIPTAIDHTPANTNADHTASPPPAPSPSMAIAKRINPGALTIDRGTSHKNTARPIPAFLTKLFTMVNDPSTDHLIKWNEPNGDSFFVVSSERFGRELLPKYFKHSNFGSFVRQLNMYGFHKVPHLNQGVLQGEIPETEMLEFTNLNFQRGQPDLLCLIQRKKPCPELSNPTANDGVEPLSTAVPANSSNSHSELQVILADIASIRKHQNLISSDLKTLQSSNAHLWKEAIANRDRNKRCQDTINKILGFLAQVFAGKLSSLQDPPPGNSGPNTPRTGVNLNQTTNDDHPMGILIHEEGSIPELERHRSRSKNSREHPHPQPNDLGYPSSPSNSALSLYSKLRHPRLMLEDTQRPPPKPPTNPSNALQAHVATNPDTTSGNGTSIRHNKYSNNNKKDKNTKDATSPSLSTRNSSSAGSSPRPDLIASPPFCDSSIDPNLETASLDGTNKAVDNLPLGNNPGSVGITDQSNPDAVLQALFNDNFSNGGGYNFNDNVFSGINWAEVFNTSNELNRGFEENKSQQQPTFMTSLSPLRITDGAQNVSQPTNNPPSSFLSPISVSNDPSNQLITDAQGQAHGIGNVAHKVESLEAAIERLVGSLPESIDYQLPMDLDSNPLDKSHHQNGNLFHQPSVPSRPDYGGSHNSTEEFDTDAFIRNLVSSGNEDQTNSVGGVGSSNLNPSEGVGGHASHVRTSTAAAIMKQSGGNQASRGRATTITDQESIDTLDLDRILDEWTCEDAARMSPGINSGRLSSSLSKSAIESSDLRGLNSHQRNFELEDQLFSSMNPSSGGASNARLINPSGDGSKNSSSSRLTLDLNDDDQLRKIMRKKSVVPFDLARDSDDVTASINSFAGLTSNETFPTTTAVNGSILSNSNPKNGEMMAISNETVEDPLINLIGSPNNNDNHNLNPANSVRKRFLEDPSAQSFHHLLPSHHFDHVGNSPDVNDQASSLSLQQKKSRIY